MTLSALTLAACLAAIATAPVAASPTTTAAPAAALDSPAANEAAIRSQLDLMNHGDWRAALNYYTPETRNFGRPVGRAVMARIFEDIYRTFPDFRHDIVDLVAVGDK
jgi:hypothetical protein